MANAVEISNNRSQDRRQGMPFFCPFHLGIKTGRRVVERRATDRGRAVYVDCYAGHLMLCTIAILFLSIGDAIFTLNIFCLLYTSPSPRDRTRSRMPSSA